MFTGVCLSTGGVPGAGGCLVRGVPDGDPRTATAAGGTHPTGMHSCLPIFYNVCSRLNFLQSIFIHITRQFKSMQESSISFSVKSNESRQTMHPDAIEQYRFSISSSTILTLQSFVLDYE